ncbi:BQ5605_C022g09455 [Microbotryum silenes-dioicae]|uniref:BQ5605_C022g09455 protein n=1 Tax=Microbotryum silenes-dioicae TaxID=796604 RepID=A0A2X0NDE2_9BASI|nr:BQ5605_C022g09455 [Microbotryum silenes-dioicae]
MKLLLLLGVLSSALHLALALAVEQTRPFVARGMSATADCAGVNTVVCSVPERSSPDSKTYRQFMKVQSIASQLSWPNGLLKPINEEVLTFYALQQQGLIGDVDISRPGASFPPLWRNIMRGRRMRVFRAMRRGRDM